MESITAEEPARRGEKKRAPLAAQKNRSAPTPLFAL